ncbi:MAG: penicillin-binding protein activator LpoB [Candidatus Rokubacteria bacterium RIFCSPLOWO2_12_FULL_71_22]|nr:MAG: penicillin-binding protein activator LpoB [Candidatus Rokubacteria bacterium RIFCSPLOWO2_12_FULL_71_22]
MIRATSRPVLWVLALAVLTSCGPVVTGPVFRDPNMDFGAIQTVGVLPFQNLSRDNLAAERVRDVFINGLLSTGAVYVVPVGEVARAVARAEIQSPIAPSPEEVVKLSGLLKAQAIITGAVREYGEVRSGASSANLISVSVQMLEAQTGRVVWTATSTRGGIDVWDRLFGGGGRPMNDVTRQAVNDLIVRLFQ